MSPPVWSRPRLISRLLDAAYARGAVVYGLVVMGLTWLVLGVALVAVVASLPLLSLPRRHRAKSWVRARQPWRAKPRHAGRGPAMQAWTSTGSLPVQELGGPVESAPVEVPPEHQISYLRPASAVRR